MKSFVIDKVTYVAPFADLLPSLAPDQLAGLERSVRENGYQSPVITARTPTWGETLLDGVTRLELLPKLRADGIDPPVRQLHLGELDDEAARRVALDVNAERRQMTPAQVAVARSLRVGRVAAAKAGGESLRSIADREGVSLGQVQRDLDDSPGVPPDTPGPGSEPQPVCGRDGKTYRQAPRGSWRDTPVGLLGLKLSEVAVVSAEGVRTLGDLCDRFDRDETFGLHPRDLADLRGAVNARRSDLTPCPACSGSGYVRRGGQDKTSSTSRA